VTKIELQNVYILYKKITRGVSENLNINIKDFSVDVNCRIGQYVRTGRRTYHVLFCILSSVAQWESGGLITPRSVDRNHVLLLFESFNFVVLHNMQKK
jgi:hypothetical protein